MNTNTASPGPGIYRKAANFGKAVVKHVADGGKHVSDEVYLVCLSVVPTARHSIPSGCAAGKSCGCRLKVKARWRSESCPQQKWPASQVLTIVLS